MTVRAVSAVMTMRAWAEARIAAQTRVLEEGHSLEEKMPSVLSKVFLRWELNAAGEKKVVTHTLGSQLTGRCLIVFLPGANTPTCSTHLPLLVEMAERLHGIAVKIVVVSVNRADDVDAWSQQHDPAHKLTFVADMDGEIVLGAGVADWSPRLGLMANRVAVVINEAGVVLDVVPEVDDAGKMCNAQCTVTGSGIEQRVTNLFPS